MFVIRGGRDGYASKRPTAEFDQDVQSPCPGDAEPDREFGSTLSVLRVTRDRRPDVVLAARGEDSADERVMVISGAGAASSPRRRRGRPRWRASPSLVDAPHWRPHPGGARQRGAESHLRVMTGRWAARRPKEVGGRHAASPSSHPARVSAPTSRACGRSRSSSSCSPTPGSGSRGGFVGVDVFFVISGFLITQAARRASSSARTRLAARLLCAPRQAPDAGGAAVIVAVVAGATMLLRPSADAVAGDMMAAGVYAKNLRRSAAAVDYFAPSADRPLRHSWSLSVEEQFYLAWPLLLLAVAWLAPRGRRRAACCSRRWARSPPSRWRYAVGHVDQKRPSRPTSPLRRACVGARAGRPGRRRARLPLLRWPQVRRRRLLGGRLRRSRLATVALRPRHADAGPCPPLLPTLGAAALLVAGTSRHAVARPTRAPRHHLLPAARAASPTPGTDRDRPVLVFAGPA